jgi:hypothetical protein
MRKSFLTREYSLEPQNGSLNMAEQRAFFTSKILKIEDIMDVNDTNYSWTEAPDNTQGIRVENVNQSFNSYQVKLNNHTLSMYPQQTDEYTKWLFTINIREIISEYLFAQLKTNRTFAGIDNPNTLTNSVDDAINQYITYNVFPRINFFNIILYVQYYAIGISEGILDSNNNPVIALQYDNQFRNDLINPPMMVGETTQQYTQRVATYQSSITVTNFQISTDMNENIASVIYKQTQSSLIYKFDYYFDVIWEKTGLNNN